MRLEGKGLALRDLENQAQKTGLDCGLDYGMHQICVPGRGGGGGAWVSIHWTGLDSKFNHKISISITTNNYCQSSVALEQFFIRASAGHLGCNRELLCG